MHIYCLHSLFSFYIPHVKSLLENLSPHFKIHHMVRTQYLLCYKTEPFNTCVIQLDVIEIEVIKFVDFTSGPLDL